MSNIAKLWSIKKKIIIAKQITKYIKIQMSNIVKLSSISLLQIKLENIYKYDS